MLADHRQLVVQAYVGRSGAAFLAVGRGAHAALAPFGSSAEELRNQRWCGLDALSAAFAVAAVQYVRNLGVN
jgi:hypothetical protein